MSRQQRSSPQDSEGSDAKIESAERLQKVLAAAGVGSRRDCEELITEGRVEVDRQVVRELGTKVDPMQHEIRVDGVVLHRPKPLYFALNKPAGVVTTNFDPSGRPRVIDYVPTQERVFPVGRLDRGSEGLILVTNDGELANRLTHPRYGIEKTYIVRVEGSPDNEQLMKLRRGVHLAEGVARVQSVRVKGKYKNVTDLEIILSEGKNREIRRILVKIGHKVLALKRIAVGPVKLGELKKGSCRKLMPKEIEALMEATRQRRRDNKRKGKPAADKPEGMKPVGSQRERPAPLPMPTSPGGAPPKIDLASLLNPSLAPKHAMPIGQAPAAAGGPPAVGDVIAYNQAKDDDSLPPLETPVRKRRRQLKEYETDSERIELVEIEPEEEVRRPSPAPRLSKSARGDAPRGERAPRIRPGRTGGRSNRPGEARAEGRPAPSGGKPRVGGRSNRPSQGRAVDRSRSEGQARPSSARPGSARPSGAKFGGKKPPRGGGKPAGPRAAGRPQRGPAKFRKGRGK